ncbi:MAG TPA: TIGR03086 family metal-binding protein [Streptosporangiaceae bacterium]
MADIRELNRRTLEATVGIVGRVSPAQLSQPTPCADWTLRQLLAHMTGQHYGFAAAASGETEDMTVWADRPAGDDFAAAYARAVARVTAAFSEVDLGRDRLWLPEIRAAVRFPAEMAIGFHFLDYVVHGWDVARSIGVPVSFDSEVLDEVQVRAAQVPEGEARLAPGAAFRPAVTEPPDASPLDRVVARLGRSPRWPD